MINVFLVICTNYKYKYNVSNKHLAAELKYDHENKLIMGWHT